MFAEWSFIPYFYSFFGRYYSVHKKTYLACIKKYDRLKGVKWRYTADSFQQGEKLPSQETPHFLFDLTFPRKWTPPTVPAGRKRGGCSWSSDTTEREEGVSAIEVTQWLELQDTSVKQEGRGSSNPWNPDLLKEARKIAARLEPRGTASNRIYRDTSFW